MIYLFDKDERLIRIVSRKAVKTALQTFALTTDKYVSDRLTVEMKALPDPVLEQVEYMAIQALDDSHNFHFFYVAQKHSKGQLTELVGVQSGIEELRKTPVYDKRPKNAFAREVIADLLVGTNWSARFVGETLPRSTNFYYTSVFDALKKACQVWDLEMQFFVQMNGNEIGARVIDFKKKIGQAVGKRVVYGHNALQILQEVERTNLYTALIGRGKGEQVSTAGEDGRQADGYGRKITFEDVVWRRSAGDPVNKPKGQAYVEIPAMTAQYGIRQANGSMKPKIGFIDFSEEEDKASLLQRTYEALVDASRPQVTFKTSAVYLKGVAIGDTIRVVRHDRRLDYETRVFELTVNRLDNQSSDIKLGDRITEGQSSRVQSIADQAVEDFVQNEFSHFVQNLPDFLPSADGFNTNWYGTDDPTIKYKEKVGINDIWYKPDPEHEGHKIMLRWTGEVWEELVRTADNARVERLVDAVKAQADSLAQEAQAVDRKAQEALTAAGASRDLAQTAKETADRAVRQAGDNLKTAQDRANQLATELATAKQSLASQARDILNQAQAQSDLTRKMQTIEETANGTKSTVTELTKTVNANTGNLSSVTQRVASTESGLAGVRDQYSQVQQSLDTTTGQVRSVSQKTADLERGLDGVRERFEKIRIGARNRLKNSSVELVVTQPRRFAILPSYLTSLDQPSVFTSKIKDLLQNNGMKLTVALCHPDNVNSYEQRQDVPIVANRIMAKFDAPSDPSRTAVLVYANSGGFTGSAAGRAVYYDYQLELGNLPSDYHPAEEDFRQEVATYIRTANENSAALARQIETADGKAESAKTQAQQTADSLKLKAEKTELDTVSGRVDTAEATIELHAKALTQRLTSTQVEQAITGKGYQTANQVENAITGKGYQTKGDVDANITGRGYITSSALDSYLPTTTFNNYKKETSKSIERELTATRALIPTTVGGRNYLKNSQTEQVITQPRRYAILPSYLESLTEGAVFTSKLRNLTGNRGGRLTVALCHPENVNSYEQRQEAPIEDNRLTVLFERPSDPSRTAVLVYANSGAWAGSATGSATYYDYQLELGSLPSDYHPAYEEMVTSVDFNRVRETAELYERVLGSTVDGEDGVKTKLARQVMTSQLFQTLLEDPETGLKTRVDQMAGNYAIRNLNSNGDVLSALNLATGGASIQVGQNKLVITPTTTFIQNGTIKSAMIESLDAGKITAGELNAANVDIINLNANKLVGLDANFIKAKIETALVDWLRGKVITAQNDAMRINLNQANISFNQDATVDFNSSNNALVRRRGTHTGFLHFFDEPKGGVYAGLGVTSSGDGVNSESSGRFAGIRIFRTAVGGTNSRQHQAALDQAEIYGDHVLIKDGFDNLRGFYFRPHLLPSNRVVDMNKMVTAVTKMAELWRHMSNSFSNPGNTDYTAMKREIDNRLSQIESF